MLTQIKSERLEHLIHFAQTKDIFQILKGELSTQCHEQHICTLSLRLIDSCEIWNTEEKDHFKTGTNELIYKTKLESQM